MIVGFAVGFARLRSERGQAQLELVAMVPLVLLVATLILQLFAVGYAQSLADGAAEAGALAAARGSEAEPAALSALPGWAERRVEISGRGGEVRVSMRAPALIPPLARRLVVRSSAYSLQPEAAAP